MQKKHHIKIGDIFTTKENCNVKVLDYKNCNEILIEFQDKHKHKVYVQSSNLKRGLVKNPYLATAYNTGYVGVGSYKTINGRTPTEEYNKWRNMLMRCYDANYINKTPTYIDCYVCDEWLNFQNFAEWYTKQKYYGLGYELDKDLLIDGNKIYSPNTCILVPQEINKLLIDREAKRGDYPIGMCFDKKRNKFSVSFSVNAKTKHLGRFDTVEQASQAYQAAKKANIKRMALEWQNRIDKRLFDALMAKAA